MKPFTRTSFTIQDFEQEADVLIDIMLNLSEQRHQKSSQPDKFINTALAQAALALEACIRSFTAIAQTED